jgi:hypothetical protein
MSWLQLAVMALISAVLTIPAVLLIPRARTSPLFDRFLWLATWLLAFLGAWLAIGYSGNASLEPVTDLSDIGRLPLVPIVVGAAAGALVLNALLWLLDRLSPPEVEEDITLEEQGDEDIDSNAPE